MSEGEKPLATAAPAFPVQLKKCRVRGCKRGAARLSKCHHCERYIQEECSLNIVLEGLFRHVILPKKLDGASIVCCKKTCLSKFQKSMSGEIRALWKKESDLAVERSQRENDAIILMLILSNPREIGKPSPIGCGYTFRCVSNLLDELRELKKIKRKDPSHIEDIKRIIVKLIRSHLGCPTEKKHVELSGQVWAVTCESKSWLFNFASTTLTLCHNVSITFFSSLETSKVHQENPASRPPRNIQSTIS